MSKHSPHKGNTLLKTLTKQVENLVGTNKYPIKPAIDAGQGMNKAGRTAKKAGQVLGHYSHHPVVSKGKKK